VRSQGPPSEIRRLAAPLAGLFDGAWQRMHWWVALMAVLYLLSGITTVKSDEVAVILRWGRLVGDTPALQQHGPGLLFTFPRPVDQIMRVQVKHVSQISVDTLSFANTEDVDENVAFTLDPVTQGYAVTGDHNIVHLDMVARYRIRDPAEWALYGPRPEDILRVEVTAAMVRSLGEMGVDRVLADGRKDLIAKATQRAQAGLDASHSGLELSSLELTRLSPPLALVANFDAVQSSYIRAETRKKDAQAFAETGIPQARGQADTAVQTAHAEAAADLAVATGEASGFRALDKEYRASPRVVRERLYRDAMERVLGKAKVRWFPPPAGGKYKSFRVTVEPGEAGPMALPPSPQIIPSTGNFDDDDQ
jgi:membrane protease subunit HflK